MNTRPGEEKSRNEVRTVWTAKDEAALAELLERKTRVVNANRDNVMFAVSQCDISLPEREWELFIDSMLLNAEAIRDALLPFDGRGVVVTNKGGL